MANLLKMLSRERFQKDSVVTGYHVYKVVWTSRIGKCLIVKKKAMLLGETFSRMPCSISQICMFFLNQRGHISCQITGKQGKGNG